MENSWCTRPRRTSITQRQPWWCRVSCPSLLFPRCFTSRLVLYYNGCAWSGSSRSRRDLIVDHLCSPRIYVLPRSHKYQGRCFSYSTRFRSAVFHWAKLLALFSLCDFTPAQMCSSRMHNSRVDCWVTSGEHCFLSIFSTFQVVRVRRNIYPDATILMHKYMSGTEQRAWGSDTYLQ